MSAQRQIGTFAPLTDDNWRDRVVDGRDGQGHPRVAAQVACFARARTGDESVAVGADRDGNVWGEPSRRTVARRAIEVPPSTRRTSGVKHVCAPSAGVVGAPRDVIGDRRGDVEVRREAGVVGKAGGVEVGVVAGAILPSGQEVEP